MNTGLDDFNPWHKDHVTIEHLISILPNAAFTAEKAATGPSNYIIVFGEHALGEGLTLDHFGPISPSHLIATSSLSVERTKHSAAHELPPAPASIDQRPKVAMEPATMML